jgi:hypothetical protein
VLHNPKSDRRTTQGIFHVTEGGLPIPDDKLGVPKGHVRGKCWRSRSIRRANSCACRSPPRSRAGGMFCLAAAPPDRLPEVPGFTPEKTMEVRFFAPGNLVSNLDFVESIFGNAGDPLLPENDAGLDTNIGPATPAASSSRRI